MSTAPHQPRKKRELTRAVETLKIVYGGERVFLTYVHTFPSLSLSMQYILAIKTNHTTTFPMLSYTILLNMEVILYLKMYLYYIFKGQSNFIKHISR